MGMDYAGYGHIEQQQIVIRQVTRQPIPILWYRATEVAVKFQWLCLKSNS